jgi:hypothetical protein
VCEGNGINEIFYVMAASPAEGKQRRAIALMTILGTSAPPHAVVNELKIIASVWTAAQFFEE